MQCKGQCSAIEKKNNNKAKQAKTNSACGIIVHWPIAIYKASRTPGPLFA